MNMVESPVRARTSVATVGSVVVAALVLGTMLPIGLHYALRGTVNVHQAGLAFFLWLNLVVNFWEICLFLQIDRITERSGQILEAFADEPLKGVAALFSAPMGLGEIFSSRSWVDLWATYTLYDPSYADRRSFGFHIDVGNGFFTLIPSLFLLYGMSVQWAPPLAFGLVLLVVSYQMFYGTVVYLGGFFFNRHHEGHTLGSLLALVGLTNGMWFVFPIWAMAVAVWMIYNQSYGILG